MPTNPYVALVNKYLPQEQKDEIKKKQEGFVGPINQDAMPAVAVKALPKLTGDAATLQDNPYSAVISRDQQRNRHASVEATQKDVNGYVAPGPVKSFFQSFTPSNIASTAKNVVQDVKNDPTAAAIAIPEGLFDAGSKVVNGTANLGQDILSWITGSAIKKITGKEIPKTDFGLPVFSDELKKFTNTEATSNYGFEPDQTETDTSQALKSSATNVAGYEFGGALTKIAGLPAGIFQRVLGNVVGGQLTSDAHTLKDRANQAKFDAIFGAATEGLSKVLGKVVPKKIIPAEATGAEAEAGAVATETAAAEAAGGTQGSQPEATPGQPAPTEPKIVYKPKKAGTLGVDGSGKPILARTTVDAQTGNALIEFDRGLNKNPELKSQVLDHEYGHVVDKRINGGSNLSSELPNYKGNKANLDKVLGDYAQSINQTPEQVSQNMAEEILKLSKANGQNGAEQFANAIMEIKKDPVMALQEAPILTGYLKDVKVNDVLPEVKFTEHEVTQKTLQDTADRTNNLNNQHGEVQRYKDFPEKTTITENHGSAYKGIKPDNLVHFNQGANERVTMIVPAEDKQIIQAGKALMDKISGRKNNFNARGFIETFAEKHKISEMDAQRQIVKTYNNYKEFAKSHADPKNPVLLNTIPKPTEVPFRNEQVKGILQKLAKPTPAQEVIRKVLQDVQSPALQHVLNKADEFLAKGDAKSLSGLKDMFDNLFKTMSKQEGSKLIPQAKAVEGAINKALAEAEKAAKVASDEASATLSSSQLEKMPKIDRDNYEVFVKAPEQKPGTVRVYVTNRSLGEGDFVDTDLMRQIKRGLSTEPKIVADIPVKEAAALLEEANPERTAVGEFKLTKDLPEQYKVFESQPEGEVKPVRTEVATEKVSSTLNNENVFYHGTTKADAESLVKNGWDPELSAKGKNKEAPYALFTSTEKSGNSDHFAGTYGDTIVEVKPKTGEEIKILDAGPEWQKYNDTFGSARNSAESAEWAKKLKDEGYDVIKEVSGETVVLSPEKFNYNIPTEKVTPTESVTVKENTVQPSQEETPAEVTKTTPVEKSVKTPSEEPGLIANTGLDTGKRVKDRLSYNPKVINAPEETTALLERLAGENHEFKSQRISKGNQDIKDLARMTGLTEDQLLNQKPGSIANAETVTAARQLVLDKAQDLMNFIKSTDMSAATPEQLAMLKEKTLKLVTMQKTVAGFRTEASNVFRSLGIQISPGENATLADLGMLMKKLGIASGDDASLFAGKVAKEMNLTPLEKVGAGALSTWYSAILSGPKTTVRNILSTASNIITEMVAKAANPKLWKEIPESVSGLLRGLEQGWGEAKEVLKGGETTTKFMDTAGQEALKPEVFTGKWKTYGQVVESVGKWLNAQDRLLSAGAREMERASLKIASPEMSDAISTAISKSYAERTVYHGKPTGRFIGAIRDAAQLLRKKYPEAKLIVPFVDTVANVMDRQFDYLPVFSQLRLRDSSIMKQVEQIAKDFSITSDADKLVIRNRIRDQQVGRMVLGTAVSGAAVALAGQGRVSGVGPTNVAERSQLEKTGWRPNSIKIGDTWVPYTYWGPLAGIFSMAGNVYDKTHYDQAPNKDIYSLISKGIIGWTQTELDQSFLKGTADLFDVVAGGADPHKYLTNLIAGTIPIPSLITQTEQMVGNPDTTTANTISEKIMQKLGLTGDLEPNLDAMGQTQKSDFIYGISPSKETNDPVYKFLVNNNLIVSKPNQNTSYSVPGSKEKRKFSGKEYTRYTKESGQEIYDAVKNQMGWIQTLPQEQQKKELQNIVDDIRTRVRNGIYFNF